MASRLVIPPPETRTKKVALYAFRIVRCAAGRVSSVPSFMRQRREDIKWAWHQSAFGERS